MSEHLPGAAESLEAIQETHKRALNGPLPGFIEAYDPQTKTCSASIAHTEYEYTDSGDIREIPWPKLDDIPVWFPGGGGITITWPLKPGDPVLLVAIARDIAEWFVSDGKEPVAPDLPDAFPEGAWICFPRLFPQKANDGEADDENLIIQCGDVEVKIEAGKVRLGSLDADKPLALAELVLAELQAYKTWADTHIHVCVSPGAPCLPPTVPAPTPNEPNSETVFTNA